MPRLFLTHIIMLSILQYDFMVRALIAGLIVAVIAPTVGLFLVSRRYSYIADTLAHVSFAGVAAGLLLGIEPIIAALVTSIGSAVCLERLRKTGRLCSVASLTLFLHVPS